MEKPAPGPDLDTVLTRVHQNFLSYIDSVPNILANEHVASSRMVHGAAGNAGNSYQTVDSVFLLQHEMKNSSDTLTESHQVMKIDNKAVPEDYKYAAPFLVFGVFGYATAYLNPELKPCYDYRLDTNKKLHGSKALVVEYAIKPQMLEEKKCPPFEAVSGRAYVDPQTMQVLRFEQKRPRHTVKLDLVQGAMTEKDAAGKVNTIDQKTAPEEFVYSWSWSVDYAPVVLNGKTFWLPKTVDSSAISFTGPSTFWEYLNTYSNYHLFEATTTFVTKDKMKSAQQ